MTGTAEDTAKFEVWSKHHVVRTLPTDHPLHTGSPDWPKYTHFHVGDNSPLVWTEVEMEPDHHPHRWWSTVLADFNGKAVQLTGDSDTLEQAARRWHDVEMAAQAAGQQPPFLSAWEREVIGGVAIRAFPDSDMVERVIPPQHALHVGSVHDREQETCDIELYARREDGCVLRVPLDSPSSAIGVPVCMKLSLRGVPLRVAAGDTLLTTVRREHDREWQVARSLLL